MQADLGPDCIRSIERGAYPGLRTLQRLAAVLGVSVAYLTGETPEDDGEPASAPFGAYREPVSSEQEHLAEEGGAFDYRGERVHGYALIESVPGRGFLGVAAAPHPAAGPTFFPQRVIRDQLRGEPGDFLWAEIAGSAMAPALDDGNHVLIDIRQTQPIDPAMFAVDEGMGPVARWVEPVAGSDPPAYRVRYEDRRLDAYQIAAERIRILGRIVWVGRRL